MITIQLLGGGGSTQHMGFLRLGLRLEGWVGVNMEASCYLQVGLWQDLARIIPQTLNPKLKAPATPLPLIPALRARHAGFSVLVFEGLRV